MPVTGSTVVSVMAAAKQSRVVEAVADCVSTCGNTSQTLHTKHCCARLSVSLHLGTSHTLRFFINRLPEEDHCEGPCVSHHPSEQHHDARRQAGSADPRALSAGGHGPHAALQRATRACGE